MRMYFFVPYNISDIQKGIQAGHCALNYARMYANTSDFMDFVDFFRTWIILNGGTTRDYVTDDTSADAYDLGTLNEIETALTLAKVPHAFFREPDLNNALTAVCFLANEQVYNYEKYPDLPKLGENEKWTHEVYQGWVYSLGGAENVFLRNLIRGKSLA
jgi:hypothetical protein